MTEDKKQIKSEVNKKKTVENSEKTSKEKESVKENAPEKKKKKIVEKQNPREFILVKGLNLRISTKNSIAVCNMIRNRSIKKAFQMLEEVLEYKRVVKMNNREVGHKKGRGVMAGRYPQNVVKEFIRLVKQLEANANNHGFETQNTIIWCKADQASRPYRGGGTRFKRTHVTLKLIKNIKKK